MSERVRVFNVVNLVNKAVDFLIKLITYTAVSV